jgi:flagellar biosynthesis repressor protein FlbT
MRWRDESGTAYNSSTAFVSAQCPRGGIASPSSGVGAPGSLRTTRQAEIIVALKIELKPFERIIVGESLITNSDQRTRFIIEGNAPILREKDILTAETANTPVKRIYLCVQMMYLENDIAKYQELYFDFVKDLLAAAPSCRKQIESASNHILSGSFYKALKEIKRLMNREATLLGN